MTMNRSELADIAVELDRVARGAHVAGVFGAFEDVFIIRLEDVPEIEGIFVCLKPGLSSIFGDVRSSATPRSGKLYKAGIPCALDPHLRGMFIQQIRAVPGDRIVSISCVRNEGAHATDGRAHELHLELFHNSPVAVMTEAGGTILTVLPFHKKHREDRCAGKQYHRPPAPVGGASPASRFPAPDQDLAANRAAGEFYQQLIANAQLEGLRDSWRRRIAARLKNRRHRVAGMEVQRAAAADAPLLLRKADLLKSVMHQIPRGASSFTTVDYFDPALPAITLELDPALPVRKQMDQWFQRARRLAAGASRTAQELEYAQKEIAALETLDAAVAAAETADSIQSVGEQLLQRRLLPPLQSKTPAPAKPGGARNSKLDAAAFRTFTSIDGCTILVGGSAMENDRLSLRVAHGNDVWLHVGQGASGAHVIVRQGHRDSVPDGSVLDAATLSVHFSKLRGAGRAEVIVTHAKFVRKPHGAPPGTVTVTGERRILLDLDRRRLERLLQGNRPDL